jgi:dihydrofolate synthase/folylpolyglutamate synthase
MNLNIFLESKTLYYDKIDYSVIKESWDIVKNYVERPFVIHIIGTNGKGTTGRFLAEYLYRSGFNTIHYSSPHILKFNERIWLNGNDIEDELLETLHNRLQEILPTNYIEKLTYFEYTTLLALLVCSGFDYLILEAGLGGEFDATNVIKNDLSLVTTIDYDHQSFLGNEIKSIAATKLRSCDSYAIIGYQIHPEVEEVADELELEYELANIKNLKSGYPKFLERNLNLACAALNHLNFKIDMKKFQDIKLQGRMQKIKDNITIDVGHNPLAAKMLLREYKGKKINLIYNSYHDKDYEKVLNILKPIIKKLWIIKVHDDRIVSYRELEKVCIVLGIDVDIFDIKLRDDEEYLVFGSFRVVEEFYGRHI